MSDLEKLLGIEGTRVAFEFAPDGRLVLYAAQPGISRQEAERMARLAAGISHLFELLTDSLEGAGTSPWRPQNGWLYCGGRWTLMVDNGRRGVVVRADQVDLNRTQEALFALRQPGE
jgi:roadblock/LC7 domain-containing protein